LLLVGSGSVTIFFYPDSKLGGKWDPVPKKIVTDPQHWYQSYSYGSKYINLVVSRCSGSNPQYSFVIKKEKKNKKETVVILYVKATDTLCQASGVARIAINFYSPPYFKPGLWLRNRIRIGSEFSDFVDPDPYWESGSRSKKIKKYQWKNSLFSYFF
jgi:hypothetical protein